MRQKKAIDFVEVERVSCDRFAFKWFAQQNETQKWAKFLECMK